MFKLFNKMESKCYKILNEIIKVKKTINTILKKINHYEVIDHLNQVKLEKKIDSKLTKKYGVIIALEDEKLIRSITAQGNYVKYYACNKGSGGLNLWEFINSRWVMFFKNNHLNIS